jgi:hypothetical protein
LPKRKEQTMKKLAMMTTAVGLCLAAPAFGQTAADQKGLVTVNLQDVLNNLSADLKVDRANIPVTAQIPINAAANVCGVNVNVLSAQAASSPATCNAKTGSQELTQAVQQQMAAGGTAAGQSGTTAAVNNPPASTAPSAAGTAPKPATTANAPATAPAANPLAQSTAAPAASPQGATAPAQQKAQSTAAPAQSTAAPAQSAAAPVQQNAQAPASTAQAPASQAAPAQQNAQGAQGTAPRAAPASSAQIGQSAPAQNAQNAPAASGSLAAQGTSAAQPAAASNALDTQQQSKIAELIVKENIKPANVTFSITQGMAIPSSVALYPVPASVLQLAPQYRGYSYFATSDRIVIVEPSKKTVVAVIQTGGAARAQTTAPAAKSVQFTQQQRELIRKRTVTSQKPMTTGSAKTRISVQQQVPESVTLEEFSEDVVREVPTAKSYRYYRQDNDVVVVDPGERRVIEVIR